VPEGSEALVHARDATGCRWEEGCGQNLRVTFDAVQIAYQTDDVTMAALAHSAQFGSGPFFLSEHIKLPAVTHKGRPALLDHSSAYGQWGNVMVELVAYHEASPASLSDQLAIGVPGLHHVACFVDDLATDLEAMLGAGNELVVEAETASGQRFAFVSGAGYGHLVELYEPTPRLTAFYSLVRSAARCWDGSDPVRPIAAA
jgi:catechol 2,3-dioxygenase-like lactoylglutathione lyase family enzyme